MKAKEIATKIFYSPATNGQAEASIEEGTKMILEYAKQSSLTQAMTTITITNEHGTYNVSADALSADDYIRLFVAAMVAASFEYETITDAIVELADELNE